MAAGATTRSACMRVATVAKPSTKPAAAAAAIGHSEVRERRDEGGSRSRALLTSGASLGGGRDSSACSRASSPGKALAMVIFCSRSRRAVSATCGASSATAGGAGVLGRGMARAVIFSLGLSGAGSLGGGGGTLGRATGMSSLSGASPTRTTTACRGGVFKPGRAMKPPRGVTASLDGGGSVKRELRSCESLLLIGALDSHFCRGFLPLARKVADLPTFCAFIK